MTTTRITRPLAHWAPDIATSDDGVPVSWLLTLATRIKAEVPDDEEGTAVICGLGACTVSWVHTLSPVEQLQATVAEMQSKAAQIRALLPIEGGLPALQADRIRELLG